MARVHPGQDASPAQGTVRPGACAHTHTHTSIRCQLAFMFLDHERKLDYQGKSTWGEYAAFLKHSTMYNGVEGSDNYSEALGNVARGCFTLKMHAQLDTGGCSKAGLSSCPLISGQQSQTTQQATPHPGDNIMGGMMFPRQQRPRGFRMTLHTMFTEGYNPSDTNRNPRSKKQKVGL